MQVELQWGNVTVRFHTHMQVGPVLFSQFPSPQKTRKVMRSIFNSLLKFWISYLDRNNELKYMT